MSAPVTDAQLKWFGETLLDLLRHTPANGDDLVTITVAKHGANASADSAQYLVAADVIRETGHLLGALRHVRGGR